MADTTHATAMLLVAAAAMRDLKTDLDYTRGSYSVEDLAVHLDAVAQMIARAASAAARVD